MVKNLTPKVPDDAVNNFVNGTSSTKTTKRTKSPKQTKPTRKLGKSADKENYAKLTLYMPVDLIPKIKAYAALNPEKDVSDIAADLFRKEIG